MSDILSLTSPFSLINSRRISVYLILTLISLPIFLTLYPIANQSNLEWEFRCSNGNQKRELSCQQLWFLIDLSQACSNPLPLFAN